MQSTNDDASQAADHLGRAMKEAANQSTATAQQTDKLSQSLSDADDKAKSLAGAFTKMHDAGETLSGLGAAGLALSKASVDADTLHAKMTGLLAGVNLSEASEQVEKLGTQIAKLEGGDDKEIGANIANAIASGNVDNLQQYGIVVDKVGHEAITAAQNTSKQAGAQEALNQILKAAGPALQAISTNTNDATKAAHAFDTRWSNIEDNIGSGADDIKAALYKNVLSPILDIIEANPGLEKTGGAIFTIGSAGASAVGGVTSVASQIALTAMAFPGLGAAAATAFSAIKIAASSTIPFLVGVASSLAVPFAILTAGVAVGIAGYEALRAMNIGGFGDTHKSTAEILSDVRKMLLGDPAAEAKKAVADATAAVQASPAPLLSGKEQAAANSVLQSVALSRAAASGVSPPPPATALGQTMYASGDLRRGYIDTSLPNNGSGSAGGGALTIHPKTRVSKNGAGHYVLKILPAEVVIPNDFRRAVEAL